MIMVVSQMMTAGMKNRIISFHVSFFWALNMLSRPPFNDKGTGKTYCP
jgi:hypothetical protein